jgi:YHS domain-containing protein
MKKIITASILIASVALAGALHAQKTAPKGKAAEKQQTMCPVMGGEVDKNVFVDYKGKRVYFCCTSCVEEFNKNPEKYMNKMRKEGVILEKSPKDTKAPARQDHKGHRH